MQRQKGFSLIELLVVIAIILIIASIAIPSILGVLRSAHEAAAAKAVGTINTAQVAYNSAYPTVGYATTLAALGGTSCLPPGAASACLIDSQIASGTKSGYNFTIVGATGTPVAAYQVIASPAVPKQTGVRYFCSFGDGVVRASDTPITTCDVSVPVLR